MGERWHVDDRVGTEFEGWTRDDSGQWYDKDGHPVAHDRDAIGGAHSE